MKKLFFIFLFLTSIPTAHATCRACIASTVSRSCGTCTRARVATCTVNSCVTTNTVDHGTVAANQPICGRTYDAAGNVVNPGSRFRFVHTRRCTVTSSPHNLCGGVGAHLTCSFCNNSTTTTSNCVFRIYRHSTTSANCANRDLLHRGSASPPASCHPTTYNVTNPAIAAGNCDAAGRALRTGNCASGETQISGCNRGANSACGNTWANFNCVDGFWRNGQICSACPAYATCAGTNANRFVCDATAVESGNMCIDCRHGIINSTRSACRDCPPYATCSGEQTAPVNSPRGTGMVTSCT